jgi:hypothetical protein
LSNSAAIFCRRQVATGGFEVRRRRRHGARDGQEDRQWRQARVFEHCLDARDVHDIADLVAVAEDRRGAVEECGLGIGAGGHHRGFDVDMRIDEARGDDAALGVVELCRAVPVTAGRFYCCDATARDPDLAAVENALRIGGQHAGTLDDQIGIAAGGGDIGETAGHGRQGRDGEASEGAHENLISRTQGGTGKIVGNAGMARKRHSEGNTIGALPKFELLRRNMLLSSNA